MSTRFVLVTVALVLTTVGCGGSGGPTAPATAPNVAGHYSGTGTLGFRGGADCLGTPFGFVSRDVEGDVRQAGATLDMDISIVVPDDTSFAPIVCFFDGSLAGTTFSATLRECSSPPSRGADPRQGIVCPDGSTRNATASSGIWTGSLDSGRHVGMVEVNFRTVDPATGVNGSSVIVMRELDLARDGG